jgi:hypothetical protein
MNKQTWKTSVEIDEVENRHYVRVIENGVISIKAFASKAEANSFANGERSRLGIDTVR